MLIITKQDIGGEILKSTQKNEAWPAAGQLHFDSFKPNYPSPKNASDQHTPMAADIPQHHHHGLRNEPVIWKSGGSYHVRIPVYMAYKE